MIKIAQSKYVLVRKVVFSAFVGPLALFTGVGFFYYASAKGLPIEKAAIFSGFFLCVGFPLTWLCAKNLLRLISGAPTLCVSGDEIKFYTGFRDRCVRLSDVSAISVINRVDWTRSGGTPYGFVAIRRTNCLIFEVENFEVKISEDQFAEKLDSVLAKLRSVPAMAFKMDLSTVDVVAANKQINSRFEHVFGYATYFAVFAFIAFLLMLGLFPGIVSPR